MVAITEGGDVVSVNRESNQLLINLKISEENFSRKLESRYQYYLLYLTKRKQGELNNDEIAELRQRLFEEYGEDQNRSTGSFFVFLREFRNELSRCGFSSMNRNDKDKPSLSSLFDSIEQQVIDQGIYLFALAGMQYDTNSSYTSPVIDAQSLESALNSFMNLSRTFSMFHSLFLVELEKKRELVREKRPSFLESLFRMVFRRRI